MLDFMSRLMGFADSRLTFPASPAVQPRERLAPLERQEFFLDKVFMVSFCNI